MSDYREERNAGIKKDFDRRIRAKDENGNSKETPSQIFDSMYESGYCDDNGNLQKIFLARKTIVQIVRYRNYGMRKRTT